METNLTDQRARFVRDHESGHWSMTERCERYGVSRPTGYKWMARRKGGGDFADRSHAPHQCPHQTSADVEALIVAARQEYGWGAKKLRQVLRTRYPARPWPARSTFNEILDRHGLLHKNRRRRKWTHPGATPIHTERPNQVWPVDFKGQFRTGDGYYCYPLTITDHFSRSLLACHGLHSVATAGTKPVFLRHHRDHITRIGVNDHLGLPLTINPSVHTHVPGCTYLFTPLIGLLAFPRLICRMD